MTIKKVEIQDYNGDVYYPHTSANVVFMSDASKLEDAVTQLKTNNGDLATLATTNKTNFVSAINELFQNVSSGKSSIATAITDKGVVASGDDTFPVLASKIGQINSSSFPPWSSPHDLFVQATPMNTPRTYTGLGVYDEKIYAMGGTVSTGYATGANECYDTVANTWSTKTSTPTNRTRHTCLSVGDKIYIIGGINGSTGITSTECYDIITNTWSTKAVIPSVSFAHMSSVVGDNIYVFTGYYSVGGALCIDTYCYNTITNTWSTKANTLTGRYEGIALAVGTNIYIIGGINSSGTTISTNECYNTITNTWSTKAIIPVATDGMSGFVVDSNIYIMCGMNSSTFSTTIRVYDIVNNTWSVKLGKNPSLKNNSKAIRVGDFEFKIGGYYNNPNTYYITNDCYII